MAPNLNFKIFGNHTDKAPIILFHESLGSVDQWKDFPELLSKATARSCIAYDRLGHGRSPARLTKVTKDFIEEEVDRGLPLLLEAANVKKFIAYGHSIGGAMAAISAANYHQECLALITEGTQSFVEETTLQEIRSVKSNSIENKLPERLRKYHGDKAENVLEAWWDIWLDAGFKDWNLGPWLPKIVCPTLVMHGTEDQYGSLDQAKRISKNVTGPASIQILAGAGHFPHKEVADRVIELVSQFLKPID